MHPYYPGRVLHGGKIISQGKKDDVNKKVIKSRLIGKSSVDEQIF